MSTNEVNEIKSRLTTLETKVGNGFDALNTKLDGMMVPLRRFQAHYNVDNPPGRWRGLGRALAAFVHKNPKEKTNET